jgi:hypothetical protein
MTRGKVPSVKTLETVTDHEKALTLRRLLAGELNPDNLAPIPDWDRYYNRYEKKVDAILDAATEMLRGYGVEALNDGGGRHYYLSIACLFVNKGGSGDPTILYDTDADRFFVSCVGDVVAKDKRFAEQVY